MQRIKRKLQYDVLLTAVDVCGSKLEVILVRATAALSLQSSATSIDSFTFMFIDGNKIVADL